MRPISAAPGGAPHDPLSPVIVGAGISCARPPLSLYRTGPQGDGIPNSILILFLVTLAFIFSTRGQKQAPRLAFQFALVVGLVSLLPTHVYPGYFSLCIPFYW